MALQRTAGGEPSVLPRSRGRRRLSLMGWTRPPFYGIEVPKWEFRLVPKRSEGRPSCRLRL